MKRRTYGTIAPARIEPLILTIRGQKVLLDSDLARIYGVTTSRLNEQVKRNVDRFPDDFCHQLTAVEWNNILSLRSQNAILNKGRGKHRKYPPYVFTEHGAIMAANVLKTPRAVQMSVFVIRAFVRLREMMLVHADIAEKLAQLERRVGQHDVHIQAIIEAIRQLMAPSVKPRREMGFRVEEPKTSYKARKRR
jgi:hypothetical protein